MFWCTECSFYQKVNACDLICICCSSSGSTLNEASDWINQLLLLKLQHCVVLQMCSGDWPKPQSTNLDFDLRSQKWTNTVDVKHAVIMQKAQEFETACPSSVKKLSILLTVKVSHVTLLHLSLTSPAGIATWFMWNQHEIRRPKNVLVVARQSAAVIYSQNVYNINKY